MSFERSGKHIHSEPHVFNQQAQFSKGLSGRGGNTSPIWSKAPIEGLCDPKYASFFFDDFFAYVTADEWTAAGDSAAVTVTDARNGVLNITPGAVTDTHAAMIHTTAQHWAIDAAKKIYFEAAITCTETGSLLASLFCGMSAGTFGSDVPLVDAGTPTTDDRIAFWRTDTTGTYWSCGVSDGTTQDDADTAITFVSGTEYRLGFIADVNSVEFYINDSLVRTVTDAGDIPDTEMNICIAVKNGSGAKEAVTVDWVKCVQVR